MKKKRIAAFLCVLFVASLLAGCNFIPEWVFGKPTTKAPDFEGLVDFVIEVPEGKEFRILQITDTQISDLSEDRVEQFGRPNRSGDDTPITEEELYNDCYYYIEQAVKEAKPDLIVMTGDNIQGEFDDDGSCTESIVAFMESLGIPWAPIFGNHDNETIKGVTWQCEQFLNAEHCLFKRGNVTGNSNYTIGIVQGGKMIKVLFMIDSNGCYGGYEYSTAPEFGPINQGEKLRPYEGLGDDQMKWIELMSKRITATLRYTPSKFLMLHINPTEYFQAAYSKGYLKNDQKDNFVIDDPTGTDFGVKQEVISGANYPGLWALMKAQNFDGVFCGHDHKNNFSILYDGIRLTYGVKTGHFAGYIPNMTGGTLITIPAGGETFQVQNVYVPDRIAE